MSNHLHVNFDGKFAYIYIWFSEKKSIIYIGETKEEHGVVGRAREHVGSNGTLRSNVLEIGYKLEQVQDFLLFSFKLPLDERYTMQNSRFTKAIEYLVQYGISDQIISKKKKRYDIVSKVNYNENCEKDDIKHIAEKIVSEFFDEICRPHNAL